MNKTPTDKAPKIASYELLGKLARGGMGTVFMARRAGTAGFQRLFAIKVIHEHLADSEECIEMFLDEARLSARLHHTNVVPVVDVGEASGRHYVVMDYVEGTSLGYLLKQSPDDRPAGTVAKIIADFLRGLHAAHELTDEDGNPMHLVHRDVSPPNVLVGVDGVGRISDFGIAKAEARLSTTRTGLRKGKLAFMAPEQIVDDTIDRRTDIFAAGATLWTALAGEPLFHGSNDASTINNLLTLEIPKPSTSRLAPPTPFDRICLKALMRDPDARYQTAEEMADELMAAVRSADENTAARDVSEWVKRVAGKTLARRKAMIASAAAPASDADVHESSIPSVGETGHGFSGVGLSGEESKRTPMATVRTEEGPRPTDEVREGQERKRSFYLAAAALLLLGVTFFVAFRGEKATGPAAAANDGDAAPPPPAALPATMPPPGTNPDAITSPSAGLESGEKNIPPRQEDATPRGGDAGEDSPVAPARTKKASAPSWQIPAPRYRGPSRRPPSVVPAGARGDAGTDTPATPTGPEDAIYDDDAPAPEPTPAPSPPPPSDPAVERNPYLRGKK
ncbi:MAG: serine/threonine-protein kinase [Myxococcota bacterium]